MAEHSVDRAIAQIEQALTNAGLLSFSGAVQLLDWSKSTCKDGPKVKFMLPDDDAVGPFELATVRKGKQAGQLYHLFAVRIDDQDALPLVQSTPGERRTPNELARRLHAEGYFRNPKLWAAMEASGNYTQAQHHEWIKTLTCCWPRLFGAANTRSSLRDCSGQVCGHHVHAAELPAAGDATGHPQKPPHWYEVPLCVNHHQNWVHARFATREDKRLLLEYAVSLTAERIKASLKAIVGIDSLGEITQDMLESFERAVGFIQ